MTQGKTILYTIASISFIYFGGTKLMGSLPLHVVIDLFSSHVPGLMVLGYILMPLVAILEIMIGISFLHKSWNQFSFKLLGVYIPTLLIAFYLRIDMSFTDSPFLLSVNMNAFIAHTCLIALTFILLRHKIMKSNTLVQES